MGKVLISVLCDEYRPFSYNVKLFLNLAQVCLERIEQQISF